jgi:hypothetical protein
MLPLYQARAASLSHVVISEVKLGGAVAGQPTEFVELFNDTNAPVDATGWILEYAKTGAPLTSQDCSAANWQTIAGTSLIKQTELAATTIQPRGRVTVPLSLNDNAGGSLRLVQPAQSDTEQVVHDLVGWSSASSSAPCKEGAVTATLPPNGKSIKRKFDLDGHPIDTDQNGNDFALDSLTPSPETDVPPPQSIPVTPPATGQCAAIVLSEILANPAGSDTDNEFIELYNSSSQTQPLTGCSLKTSASSKQYNLPVDQSMAAGEYRAFYYNQTGLTITNSGGQVWLITPDTETIVDYPSASDDQAWIAVNNQWQATYEPTSNAPNVLKTNLDTEVLSSDSSTDLADCPAGKYRNPDTNRCKTIAVDDSGLAPCDVGQERNPATNRCRSLASAIASLVPCQDGYERNPETNRCRKVSTLGSSDLKPCDPGQERNPDTNRCRKSTGTVSPAAANSDQNDSKKPSVLHYGAIAAVIALVVGYAGYEYRSDIGNIFARFKSRKKS